MSEKLKYEDPSSEDEQQAKASMSEKQRMMSDTRGYYTEALTEKELELLPKSNLNLEDSNDEHSRLVHTITGTLDGHDIHAINAFDDSTKKSIYLVRVDGIDVRDTDNPKGEVTDVSYKEAERESLFKIFHKLVLAQSAKLQEELVDNKIQGEEVSREHAEASERYPETLSSVEDFLHKLL
jgi:hypothetical protein